MEHLMSTVMAYWQLLAILMLLLYAVLTCRWINNLLPLSVRRFLNDPTVVGVVKNLGGTSLTNEEKRQSAVQQIGIYLSRRGIALSDNQINLFVETLVRTLKARGSL